MYTLVCLFVFVSVNWYSFIQSVHKEPSQRKERKKKHTNTRTIPAFAFPAEAGTHLPTPEGWKAELALGGWLVTYRNKCPAPELNSDTVAHLSTNRTRRRLTLYRDYTSQTAKLTSAKCISEVW